MIKYIAKVSILVALIVYGGFAFMHMSFDINAYSRDDRGMMLIFWLGGIIAYFALLIAIYGPKAFERKTP